MDNNQELLDKYIVGELSNQELQELQKKMRSDKVFKKDIELIDAIQETISIERQLEGKVIPLKKTLQSIGEQHFSTTPVKKIFFSKSVRKWIMAASFLGFLFFSFFTGKQHYSTEQLIANNFIPINVGNRSETASLEDQRLLPVDPKYLYQQYTLSEYYYTKNQLQEVKEIYLILLDNQQNTNYDTRNINFELVTWNNIVIDLLLNEDTFDRQLEELLASDISVKYKEQAQKLRQKRQHFLFPLFN